MTPQFSEGDRIIIVVGKYPLTKSIGKTGIVTSAYKLTAWYVYTIKFDDGETLNNVDEDDLALDPVFNFRAIVRMGRYDRGDKSYG